LTAKGLERDAPRSPSEQLSLFLELFDKGQTFSSLLFDAIGFTRL
jgi:hypothetical protein